MPEQKLRKSCEHECGDSGVATSFVGDIKVLLDLGNLG